MADFIKELAGDDLDFAIQLFRDQRGGTPEEYRVFSELEDRGLVEGEDFSFQSDRFGGLSHIGNAKIHFLIPMLKLALRVQPVEWIGEPRNQKANDIVQALVWQARNWFVADLVAQEINQNVKRVVGLAFDYQDSPLASSALR